MHWLRVYIENIVEDKVKENFIASSVEYVQKRVAKAEENNNFTSHEEFWSKIDNKTKNL